LTTMYIGCILYIQDKQFAAAASAARVEKKMEKHSEKGMKTLEAMGTVGTDWAFVEIKWEKRMRLVPVKVPCEYCGGGYTQYTDRKELRLGTGYAFKKTFMVNGVAVDKYYNRTQIQEVKKELLAKRGLTERHYCSDQELFNNGYDKVSCPECVPSRGRGKGHKVEMQMKEVMVGIPQWATGTLFDSRFSHADCNLCGKDMIRTNLVPITGKGADGRIHGMWVGSDCAKKFCGIKNFKLKEDQFLDVPEK
jgi:hypothetical protein